MIWATVLFDVVTLRQDYTTGRLGAGEGGEDESEDTLSILK